jgi:hypothetical protein
MVLNLLLLYNLFISILLLFFFILGVGWGGVGRAF